MTAPVPSPSKLVEDTVGFPPQPLGNQQALELEDVIEIVEPLPNELQCPLCLEFLKEPTLTSCCGHHFCRECIHRVITRSHVCPLCNNKGFQTFLNKEKQRVINTLKVYCRRKSQGCEWEGELGRLEHHLDVEEGDCGCVEVECEFGPVGCVVKLPRKDLQRHKEENVHKHLVLMSVMSLKSNEAFVNKLREQRVEFQQQLKQKDDEIQDIRQSLQKLTGQLQQKDQQIADIQDQLLQRNAQIAIVQQNMETKQRSLVRQLKGDAEQLEVQLTENAKQFAKVEKRLEENDQQLTTYVRENEKRLGDVERRQEEEKQEVSRRDAEVYKTVQEAKTQSKANEKRLDDVERKTQVEINRQLVMLTRREKGEEVWIQLWRDYNQMDEEMTGLRRRIEQVETSLAEGQGQAKEVNEKVQKQLVTFIPPPDFIMTDFQRHKKDNDKWLSPPFYSHIGGYKMCLRVVANGQARAKDTHVSVAVHLMHGEHDDHLKWPFNGYISVIVLNQITEEEHVGRIIPFCERITDRVVGRVVGREMAATGSGFSEFIAHSALGYNSAKNTQYLTNDCLKFRVINIELKNL